MSLRKDIKATLEDAMNKTNEETKIDLTPHSHRN